MAEKSIAPDWIINIQDSKRFRPQIDYLFGRTKDYYDFDLMSEILIGELGIRLLTERKPPRLNYVSRIFNELARLDFRWFGRHLDLVTEDLGRNYRVLLLRNMGKMLTLLSKRFKQELVRSALLDASEEIQGLAESRDTRKLSNLILADIRMYETQRKKYEEWVRQYGELTKFRALLRGEQS